MKRCSYCSLAHTHVHPLECTKAEKAIHASNTPHVITHSGHNAKLFLIHTQNKPNTEPVLRKVWLRKVVSVLLTIPKAKFTQTQ